MNEQEQKATATPPAQVSEHAELRRLAEAATPGPWDASGHNISDRNDRMEIYDEGGHSLEDAAYIAAANPAAILALLDDFALLQAVRDAERASAVAAKGETVAWLHTLDNTDGIEGNEPHEALSFSEESPFGVPGRDHSESYPATSEPLYTAPIPSEVPGEAVAVANLDQLALDTATKILPMYFEQIPGTQLKARIQIAVREAIDASRPDIGAQRWKEAYLNMRKFAEDSGLDTTCYGPAQTQAKRG